MTAFARAYLERKITEHGLRTAGGIGMADDAEMSPPTREPAVEFNHYTHTTRVRSIAT